MPRRWMGFRLVYRLSEVSRRRLGEERLLMN